MLGLLGLSAPVEHIKSPSAGNLFNRVCGRFLRCHASFGMGYHDLHLFSSDLMRAKKGVEPTSKQQKASVSTVMCIKVT